MYLMERKDNDNPYYEIDENEIMGVNVNGSFLDEPLPSFTHEEIAAFSKYFKYLKPGVVIPPSRFQDWLHPDFKFNFTKVPRDFPSDWLIVHPGPHYSIFPQSEHSILPKEPCKLSSSPPQTFPSTSTRK